jgi:hypothetical protein
MFPPVVKAQRTEPLMNAHLAALVKRVAELHRVRLKACHCVEEFHLQQIRPLGHQDKCAYEWPGWLIPVVNLLMVSFPPCLLNVGDTITPI